MRYIIDAVEGESVRRHLRIKTITELVVNVRRKKGAPIEGITILKRANAKPEYRESIDPSTLMHITALCALFYVEMYEITPGGTKTLTHTSMEWINIER